jgi:hypothetical protein
MRLSKYIILTFVLVTALTAQETRYGGEFLELGIGPRALALGGAYTAVADDGSGMYWNPAGVAFSKSIQVSLMYADLFNSLENHSFASASLPIFGGAILSAAWIRLSVDDIPRFDDADLIKSWGERQDNPRYRLTDPAIDYFSFSNNAYYITFSKVSRVDADLGWHYFELPIDFGYGVNFKMIDVGLDENKASGVGIDAGIKFAMGLDDLMNDEHYGKLSFGISVIDLLDTKLNWDTDSKHQDIIQRKWRYGFAYTQPVQFLDSQFMIVYDINSKYSTTTHLGVEALYKGLLAIRMGSNAGKFTAGAGLSYWKITLDYAYQGHDLGNSHRVGTSFVF